MDRRVSLPLFVLSAALMSTAANAQISGYAEQQGVQLGGSLGAYLPQDSFIKKAFGDTVTSVGFGPVGDNLHRSGSLTPDFDILSANKNGNRLFISSLTYGYEYHFSDDKSIIIPYARVFGGGAYFDYGVDTATGRKSSKRFGTTYGAEVGIQIAGRARVSAAYNQYTKQQGLDFRGYTISATWSLFRL